MKHLSSNISWQIVNWIDKVSGLYFMENSPLRIQFKIHRFLMFCLYLATLIIVLSTLFQFSNSLLVLILSLCTLVLLLTSGTAMFNMIRCSKDVKTVIEWLRNKEERHQNEFKTAITKCNKWIKYLTIIIFVFGTGSGIVIFLIGAIFPGLLFDKFKLPMPLYLPVKNQETWLVYFISSFLQIGGYFQGNCIGTVTCCLAISLYFDLTAYFDVILMEIKKLKTNIAMNNLPKPKVSRKRIQNKFDFKKELGTIINMITESSR